MITFLVDKGLLPRERARMLRGWVHSGFNVNRGRRGALPGEREDMERLAQGNVADPFEMLGVCGPSRAGPRPRIRIDCLTAGA